MAELISDDRAFRDLIDMLCDEPRYAIDTEFVREKTYYPQVALVQLAWADSVALVDPLAVDLRPLEKLMKSDGTAVIHAASQDLIVLEQVCGAAPNKLFDPQIAGAFLGHGTASLSNLVRQVLGVKLSKSHQLANWMRRPLDEAALKYAVEDVAHLTKLHDALVDELHDLGRLSWAQQECDRMRERDRTTQDPDTAWWKLKGKRRLTGSSARVAQALAAWRERRAQKLDRPTKTVLSDFAILGMAQRPPKSESELQRIRGLDRNIKGRFAEQLLEVVASGLSMDSSQVQAPPAGPADRANPAAVTLCLAWASQVARESDLEPSVLATRDEISDFVRGRATRLDHGWRHELLGKELHLLISGRAALCFRGTDLEMVNL